jgi:hypothetical protein
MHWTRGFVLAAITVGCFAKGHAAEESRTPAEQAQDQAASMLHTVELGQICGWTTDSAEILHRDLQRVATHLLQERVLRGQLMPVEAMDAESTWLLPVTFRLFAHNAPSWKSSGECQRKDWRESWDLFEQVRHTLPDDAPETLTVREESRLHVAQVRAQSCNRQATLLLDDRISSAEVIATGVLETCRAELADFLTQSTISNGTEAGRAGRLVSIMLGSDELRRKLTTGVLDARARARTSGTQPARAPVQP